MVARILVAGIVCALGCSSALAEQAASVGDSADATDTNDDYQKSQLALFDSVRADPSPRIQALAGRLYVDDDETPAALRPKRADVVARATGLAPDDAFVQWMGADTGNYYSSQCGPTHWPEAEVANLVRLEPDNAGALQYAVALAHAKGDPAALDEALARMASAQRADDHLGDEIAAWTRVYVAHPVESPFAAITNEDDASPQSKALLGALQRTGFHSSPVESALEAVCKPDAESGLTWQRLGRCADAGVLLATRGNSFALRELGLKMLTAAGATHDDLADLQRPLDWLKANAANPMQNGAAFADAPNDRAADWNFAPNEIAATERRLKRLGKPLLPPAGWMPDSSDDAEDPDAKAALQTWQDYVRSLVDELARSSDVRERAIGLASESRVGSLFGGDGAHANATAGETAKKGTDTALPDFAAANAGDLLVQWIAAGGSGSARDLSAVANVQRLDKDNAAAWALSLGTPGVDVQQTLQHMAASHRYDEHTGEIIPIWLAAVKRHPVPAEMTDRIQQQAPQSKFSDDDIVASTATVLAAMTAIDSSPYASVNAACANADAARKPLCIATGRLMFNGGHSLMTAMIGEMLLRQSGALTADEREQARRLAWWRESSMREFVTNQDAISLYVRDTITTGSEIEALRLAMTRAGKAEPPADWKSHYDTDARKAKATGN